MKPRIATIILNRNLPDLTDRLVDDLKKSNTQVDNDIFVVEAGSKKELLSKNYTWHNQEDEVVRRGLRYPRGMNYGLFQLYKENLINSYDYFFLLTNDTKILTDEAIIKLVSHTSSCDKIGLISPIGKNWGEQLLFGKNNSLLFFWFIHNTAFLVKKEFFLDLANFDENYQNFFFDGSNFRGYMTELELITKGYANNWASSITNDVEVVEDESFLLNHSDLIDTESYPENINLYLSEGLSWLKRKYGFNSHWHMQQYSINFYEKFFEFNPEYIKFKV